MKFALTPWGISSFVAHEDIQALREWRDDVEAGLETMQVMVSVVQPGFKESDNFELCWSMPHHLTSRSVS